MFRLGSLFCFLICNANIFLMKWRQLCRRQSFFAFFGAVICMVYFGVSKSMQESLAIVIFHDKICKSFAPV